MNKWLKGLLAVSMFAAVIAPVSSSSAATDKPDRWGAQVALPGGGVERSLTTASGEIIAKVGWIPETQGSPVPLTSVTPLTTEVTPMNASGCTGIDRPVCIFLYGSGIWVDDWNTKAIGNWGCSTAHFITFGNTIRTMGPVCPSSGWPGVYYAYWHVNGRFQDGTTACNMWTGSYSKPCKDITS